MRITDEHIVIANLHRYLSRHVTMELSTSHSEYTRSSQAILRNSAIISAALYPHAPQNERQLSRPGGSQFEKFRSVFNLPRCPIYKRARVLVGSQFLPARGTRGSAQLPVLWRLPPDSWRMPLAPRIQIASAQGVGRGIC
jgi:hypothetical protein